MNLTKLQADCVVEVRLKNGEVLRQVAEHTKGCRDNPLIAEERCAKFVDGAATCQSEARAMETYSKLLEFCGMPLINEVTLTFAQNQADI